MKIIFLNIWKGKMFDPLMEFIKQSANMTDFFCFQEMTHASVGGATLNGGRTNMFSEISGVLPDFNGYLASVSSGFDEERHVSYEIVQGQAIFVKKNISLDSHGEIFVYGEKAAKPQDTEPENLPALLQYVRFKKAGMRFTLANMHGIPYPGNKLDDASRREQSRRILSFLAAEQGGKILGGDFNMLPQAESIGMIENAGMRDLIKEFNVTGTRNEFAYGLYPEENRQYFADFIFVSPDVHIVDFQAPYCLISDHLPLILEIM